MTLLYQAPQEVKSVVVDYLVPLFLLYNILGWVGLPGREAARSQTPPTPEDSAALGKSIWAAWWRKSIEARNSSRMQHGSRNNRRKC